MVMGKNKRWLIGVAALCVAGFWYLSSRPPVEGEASPAEDVAKAKLFEKETPRVSEADTDAVSAADVTRDLIENLFRSGDDASVKASVEALRDHLSEFPDGVDPLIQAWARGESRSLPAGFSIGKRSEILSASSSRAVMLNLLADADPEFALAEAESILSNTDDADLHSVAMQTVSKLADSIDTAERLLDSAVTYHLSNDTWLSEPTVGFLQGFDLAVAHPAETYATQLLDLESGDHLREVQYAARLVLDRWSQEDYMWTVEQFRESPLYGTVDFRLRAQTFARANPESQQELQAFIAYLEDSATSIEEAGRALSLYPLMSNHVSRNLVSVSRPPRHAHVADVVALAADWLTEYADETEREELLPLVSKRIEQLRR